MNFWKQNSSAVSRLVITHIGMAVFGLVLFLMTNQRSPELMLAAGIFSAIFYAVIVYTSMWEYGAKDKPAVDAGRLPAAGLRGVWISLLAESPALLAAVLLAVFSFFKTSSAAAGGICGIAYPFLTILCSCFTGIMRYFNPVSTDQGGLLIAALFYIGGSVLISAAAGFGYSMGTKERTLLPGKRKS